MFAEKGHSDGVDARDLCIVDGSGVCEHTSRRGEGVDISLRETNMMAFASRWVD